MIVAAVLGALICELVAPRLAGLGFLSLAPACYLWLALMSPAVAAGALVAGLLFRSLAKPSPKWVWEVLLDALPGLAMLALLQTLEASQVWRGLAGLQLYLALTALVPTLVSRQIAPEQKEAWDGARLGALLLRLGAGCTGVLVALSSQIHPAYALWGLPIMLVLQHGCQGQSRQAEALLRHCLDRRLKHTESHLVSTQLALSSTREELGERVEAFEVLHQLSRRLAEASQPRQALEILLDTAACLVSARSLVIFDEHLRPVLFRSPHQQRLAGWELGHFHEPSVEQAWQSRRVASLATPASDLTGEIALAVPLEGFGVLYVGTQRALSDSQVELVCVLARQTAAALHSLRQLEALQQAAEREGQQSRHLQDWLNHLGGLLESLQSVAGSLEPEEQRRRLELSLERLVPHDRRKVFLGSWPAAGTPEAELVERLRTSPVPLLYEDLSTSRLAALGGCLLAFGLRADSQMLGAVLLVSDEPRRFAREHQQLMGLLSFQAGMALHNAQLHRQTLDALRQLQESQSQMVMSSKLAAVGQLAAGMAHELNTPLATVLMAVEMASLEGTPRTQANLHLAARQVMRAQSLIEKVLYYSRDGLAGKQPVHLTEVVADTLLLVASDFKGCSIEVQRDLTEVPSVLGNPNEVQQVVLNLLLNARDAVENQPEPRIRVSTEATPAAVVVTVEDNGSGIDPHAMDRIFDPFFTTKEPGKGTGLGLSISREIAQKHGGQLQVTNSTVGVSARLSLPIQAE
ncbi:GHKL domain-containing protein [bacterium]|nr:GHKL domain-containing protein [bacterium]